jgi:AraC-like DNA-binding protein
LINKNRVKYFIDLIAKGKSNDENLETLSQKAGFNSRHHLLRPFKKFHGGNPSDFIKAVFPIIISSPLTVAPGSIKPSRSSFS